MEKGEIKMDKKTINLLLILMMLTIIGIMILPASIGSTGNPSDFTITISSGQNTAVTDNESTAFSAALPGTTNEIADSFDLTNAGNVIATVDAKFTTNNGTLYGLDSDEGGLGGANFSLAVVGGTYTALLNTNSDQSMNADCNVAADNVADVWKAKLIVPAGQASAAYTGTVQLTFEDA